MTSHFQSGRPVCPPIIWNNVIKLVMFERTCVTALGWKIIINTALKGRNTTGCL
jgi:hypothetical protein